MNKIYRKIKVLALLIFLPGCAAMVAGTAATGVIVAQDRRTTGTIVEDKSIQLKATSAIQQVAQDDPQVHVSAMSYNNSVLLIGQVPARKIRNDIEKKVRRIEKIKHLYNEIQLDKPTSMRTRSNDSWITTKVKSEMALSKFNPTRVKVVTEDSVVYLMGIVTAKEEQMATDIARHTKGVKKVVKIFEYER